jgi:ABC-type multidrug transport system permease subunit
MEFTSKVSILHSKLSIILMFYADKKWIQARRGPDPRQKGFLSVSGIAGILVAVILIITAVVIAGYFVVRNR